MRKSIIHQRLTAYRHWKTQVTRAISELQSWLESEGLAASDIRDRIQNSLDALDRDRLTVAVVAEFSRGKTELINAIFFADYGRRILPSTAGRTTMCPTELLWDEERSEAYLRLLPIETRAQDIPIAQIKNDPKQWVHYPLRVNSPEQMTATLSEILQTKKVSMAEATRLGLSTYGLTPEGQPSSKMVEIPKWRHATISFPHPLLRQGLVVLDTPGLNTLGSEPELTLSMLPAAQAVIFVLAADTGVTRSDLEMWQHHLKGFQTERQRSMVVALNKIDVLWDELRDAKEVEATIATQRAATSETLGISDSVIFPVSAQKALLAKIRGDSFLLSKSALPALEAHLSEKMLETKHQVLVAAMEEDVGQLLESNRTRISTRIGRTKAQLQELEQLRQKSDDVIAHLLEKTREEQEHYLKGVHQFQTSRDELLKETQLGHQILDRDNIASVIEKAYGEMVRSWTTRGIANAMKRLFDELRRAMKTLSSESQRIGERVQLTYRRFEEEFGFNVASPKVFVPTRLSLEIELLYQEVDAFRKSPAMALSEQGIVIKRFQQQMVKRALLLFEQLRTTFDAWTRDALRPLAEQIQDHKQMMEKRLENLQRIGQSKDSLQDRIDELQSQYVELAHQLTTLRNIHNTLHYDPLLDYQRKDRPHLVASRA